MSIVFIVEFVVYSSDVDEVVLSYIADALSVLREEDGVGESSFDVELFSEMISAYVPEFSEVDKSVSIPYYGMKYWRRI